MLEEILDSIAKKDPVRGCWHVPKMNSVVVWSDASSIDMWVVREIDWVEVEDAA